MRFAGARRELRADRHPDLETAIAGRGIEALAVTLEIGRIGDPQAGRRQPVIPDRVDGATNARDVLAMREHGIFLLGDAHAHEGPRQVGEIAHLDARDVVEIAGIVAIAADAVGGRSNATGNVIHGLVEALPEAGNACAIDVVEAVTDACDEEWLAGLKAWRIEMIGCG